MKTALLILAEGFEEIEALTPVDVLRRGGINVKIGGLQNELITGSHQIIVKTDMLLRDDDFSYDLIILPGGMPGAKNLAASPPVKKIVMHQFSHGGLLGAICAAPALTLAAWGILDHKRATCYPGMDTNFPASATYSAEPVVIDQNIITANGVGSALRFSFALLAALTDAKTAQKLQSEMLA